MKTKLLSAVAAVPLLTIAHMGSAAEPLALSEVQMDIVTAGFSAMAHSDALAQGNVTFAFTDTQAFVRKLTDSQTERPFYLKSTSMGPVQLADQGNVDLFVSSAWTQSESISQGLSKIPLPVFNNNNGPDS
ncbi:MAG: hypothetical protein EA405_03860 [Rhodospirillales bacterium]|nr:MAG: hypothetical protein EA405_03860 [Rhodospirillales bacterium]